MKNYCKYCGERIKMMCQLESGFCCQIHEDAFLSEGGSDE